MPIVDMKDLLQHAHEHDYAVAAFELESLDFLQGVLDAAERCHAPVVLNLCESWYADFELVMPAVEAAAKRAAVPVALHLDHGASLDIAVTAIRLGCNGLRVAASHLPPVENLRLAREMVAMAHACGVPVEGGLGGVPSGGEAGQSPAEARDYVEKTGVDFLAVSLGDGHAAMTGMPESNVQHLAQLKEALDIPLVIHAGSGCCDHLLPRLVASGVARINFRLPLLDSPAGPAGEGAGVATGRASAIRQRIAAEAERRLRLCGSAGRAAEVLARCRPWTSVEHVIVYNVSGIAESQAEAMMALGRGVLGAIPGVREVVTGRALRKDAKFHYVWLVRFCHPAVIDSYRDHPDHVAFADRHFRPVAGERVSIDFLSLETAPPCDSATADTGTQG